MAKKIYYKSVFVHNYIKNLLDNPPKGYEFAVNIDNKKKALIDKLRSNKAANFLYKKIIKKFFNAWEFMNKGSKTSQLPQNIDLIFSTDSIVEGDKPWVIKILDNPFALAGNDYRLFRKNLAHLEEALSSDNCRAIIVHTEASKKIMEKYFSKDVVEKAVVLTPAIPGDIKARKEITGQISDKRKEFTILFMGSTNNPDVFYLKGGLETLETFKLLSKKYDNIKLIMRCKIPREIIKRYGNLKDVEFLERYLSDEEMDNLYKNSDVLMSPGYNYFIMAFLEAFSYGVPIVALDTYGVKEFVHDGKNGFIVKPSRMLPINREDYPVSAITEEFTDIIKKGDPEVIRQLAERVSMLIDNKELLEKLGKECQRLFKEDYSFEKKQDKLKKIFDMATSK